jgi:hypothetical protein
MVTVAEQLLEWLDRLEKEADHFLLAYSATWLWNVPSPGFTVITGSPYAWCDLPPEARVVQAGLLDELRRWGELCRAVLAKSAESIRQNVASAHESILEVIDQSAQTHYENVGEARSGTQRHFVELRRALEPLSHGNGGPPLLIPDTNALLYEPRLEEWDFADVSRFELVLLPTVLGELDELKVHYRRDSVREKAEKLIRQIKGYRARGQITKGVPLRDGRSTIRAVAAEPRRDTALSWMSWDCADDRLLSSVLELMRDTPARAVALVTRDLNLQNKADFARVLFLEPPDLPGGTGAL